jgi:sterol desaturase/sphingolipid hydroxylase (fatty acid hydroxylase superfamily)
MRTEDDIVEWAQPIHLQLLSVLFCIVFNHFFFYLAHRALHIPIFYKHIFQHRQHHRYINSVSISAEFASPLEQIFANFLPTYGSMFILSARGAPMSLWMSWLFCRLWETFEAHSSFDFRGTFLHQIGVFIGSTSWHCFHHSNFAPNFASCFGQYYLDWIFQTDDAWLMEPNLADFVAPCQSTELDW